MKTRRAVRQRAIAALNLTQQAKQFSLGGGDNIEEAANTALLDGVRKIAIDVRELDIDLIDRINPFRRGLCDPRKDHERG